MLETADKWNPHNHLHECRLPQHWQFDENRWFGVWISTSECDMRNIGTKTSEKNCHHQLHHGHYLYFTEICVCHRHHCKHGALSIISGIHVCVPPIVWWAICTASVVQVVCICVSLTSCILQVIVPLWSGGLCVHTVPLHLAVCKLAIQGCVTKFKIHNSGGSNCESNHTLPFPVPLRPPPLPPLRSPEPSLRVVGATVDTCAWGVCRWPLLPLVAP